MRAYIHVYMRILYEFMRDACIYMRILYEFMRDTCVRYYEVQYSNPVRKKQCHSRPNLAGVRHTKPTYVGELYTKGLNYSYHKIAKNLSISAATANRVCKIFYETGNVHPKIQAKSALQRLNELFLENPSYYIENIL